VVADSASSFYDTKINKNFYYFYYLPYLLLLILTPTSSHAAVADVQPLEIAHFPIEVAMKILAITIVAWVFVGFVVSNSLTDLLAIGVGSTLTSGLYIPYKLFGVWRRCHSIHHPQTCRLNDGCYWNTGIDKCTTRGILGLRQYWKDRNAKCRWLSAGQLHMCIRHADCYWSKGQCKARILFAFRNTRHQVERFEDGVRDRRYLRPESVNANIGNPKTNPIPVVFRDENFREDFWDAPWFESYKDAMPNVDRLPDRPRPGTEALEGKSHLPSIESALTLNQLTEDGSTRICVLIDKNNF
jgi:hypothetical protein